MVREARLHVGMDAPVHLFLGQIEVESACREGATAFDGGMGLSQFMPSTAREVQEREAALWSFGAPFPYDPAWAIRAMILYDRHLLESVTCATWHLAFRAYNGGLARLNREIASAGSCDPAAIAGACRRGALAIKGRPLSLCAVNIAYPAKIEKAAARYRARLEGGM